MKKRKREKTGKKQARGPGGRFAPGKSGNPKGRPRGSRNQTTLAAEALLDGEAERLTRKAVQRALAGDTVALRICLDRIIPPRRERTVTLDLPATAKASQIPKALASVIQAVADGGITPGEAATLASVLQAQARVIESAELEQRIRSLEQTLEGSNEQ